METAPGGQNLMIPGKFAERAADRCPFVEVTHHYRRTWFGAVADMRQYRADLVATADA